jgi:hypothetical protein
MNPQSLNSYSYANDNPITGKDPTGRSAALVIPIAIIVATLYAILAILSSPQLQHASSEATSAILNQSSQIVQTLSNSHPLSMPQQSITSMPNQPLIMTPTVTTGCPCRKPNPAGT